MQTKTQYMHERAQTEGAARVTTVGINERTGLVTIINRGETRVQNRTKREYVLR